MKFPLVQPSLLPNRILLGPKYSPQDHVLNTLRLIIIIIIIINIARLYCPLRVMPTNRFNSTCAQTEMKYHLATLGGAMWSTSRFTS